MSHPTSSQLEQAAQVHLDALRASTAPITPRVRIELPAQEMPTRDPVERRQSMQEVALGYTEAQVRLEAQRCLQCRKAPCVQGCPVGIEIPEFIKAIADGRDLDAIAIIRRASLLPAVCGRVCPQETQCQAPCTVGKSLHDVSKAVMIGRLERYVADLERESGHLTTPAVKPATGKRVAVIGAGPAGITVAADVRREGHEVVMFEAFHKPGGVLMYGIPEFRLPKAIVQQEIDTLRAMGVRIEPNFVVGRTRRLHDLLEQDGFDAAFIGCGAGLPNFMNIPGENLVGVFSANEYLTRANLMRAYDKGRAATPIYPSRRVAVLGGGNVAMDSARMAVRLGAEEVHLIYRRTEAEMPARVEEVGHAKEEGVIFHVLENAKRVVGDATGRVTGLECLRYELGAPDKSGRPRPVEIAGSEFMRELDTVIVAIGNSSNPLIRQTTAGLETDKRGNIVVDGDGQTSIPGVYAGGDIVLGAATVILAMGEGRRAAAAINRRLTAANPNG